MADEEKTPPPEELAEFLKTMAAHVKDLAAHVADLEDKLAKGQITQDDWKAFRKVAASLGPHAPWIVQQGMVPAPPGPTFIPKPCAILWQPFIPHPCAILWQPLGSPGPRPGCWPPGFGSGFGEFGT
jgi:hypothetical protein